MKKRPIGYLVVGFIAGLLVSHIPWPVPDAHEDEHEDEHADHDVAVGEVVIEEAARRLLGVKTVKTTLADFSRHISVTGRVAKDVEEIAHVSAGVRGTVASCSAKVGTIVHAGDVMCIIRNANGRGTTEVKAPITGLLASSSCREGGKVRETTSLHTIEDLSRLPVVLDVYEKDIGRIKLGQRVEVTSVAYPGKIFPGTVSFISPRVDDESRAIRVRVLVDNGGYLLKLGMFVSAKVFVSVPGKSVVLPKGAVSLIGGKNSVFVTAGDGIFKPRVVELSGESDGKVAISKGLAPGEFVVTEGVFILKSELLRTQLGAGCAD